MMMRQIIYTITIVAIVIISHTHIPCGLSATGKKMLSKSMNRVMEN